MVTSNYLRDGVFNLIAALKNGLRRETTIAAWSIWTIISIYKFHILVK